MASFTPTPSLMGLPGEIRHKIMLQVFHRKYLTIELIPTSGLKEGESPWLSFFDTAPLLVCKQMRFDALAAMMRGIQVDVDSLCDMQYLDVLPISIRQCIRWFKSMYERDCCGTPPPPKDVWLGPSSLRQLPNLESVHLVARGETCCEIKSADGEAGLRSQVESQSAVGDIDLYLRDECDIYMELLGKLERDVIVYLDLGLTSNYDLAMGSGSDRAHMCVSQRSQPAIATNDEVGPRNLPQQEEDMVVEGDS